MAARAPGLGDFKLASAQQYAAGWPSGQLELQLEVGWATQTSLPVTFTPPLAKQSPSHWQAGLAPAGPGPSLCDSLLLEVTLAMSLGPPAGLVWLPCPASGPAFLPPDLDPTGWWPAALQQ